jgi:hypothetical protein
VADLMNREQRIAKRANIAEQAVQHALRQTLTGVCAIGNHARCRYGEPECYECLCECHDNVAALGVTQAGTP